MRRALILDRDGVMIHDRGYVHRIYDCHFIEGIFDLAGGFAARGFLLVVATNQSGIGRGYFSEEDFQAVMDWIIAQFAAACAPIAAVYHCPYHPTEGIGHHRADSDWRKPNPGMLLQAAADLDLDLRASWCVGDQLTDIEAGRTAGVGTLVLLDPGVGATVRREDYWVVPNLHSVEALIAEEA